MHKVKCNKCGKEMMGYTKQHAEYMLSQHMIKHENEKKKEEKKK